MTDTADFSDTRYNQLAEQLADAIRRGTLAPGSRLPSVRRSAQTWSVSINTVVAAYRRLEDRGFIEARPQSGFYVRAALPALTHQPHEQPQTPAAEPADEVLDLIDKVFASQIDPTYTNLSLACPQSNDFIRPESSGELCRLLRRQPNLIGQYALPPGSPALRQQIARRALTLGMILEPADITITHGCMEALQLALRVTTKLGDSVGLETPTYFLSAADAGEPGLKAVEIPTDPQTGLSLDVLEMLLTEKRLNAVIAMPTAQNPLGFTMPLAAKKRLARLMNDHQVPLIEDGLYAEIQFGATLSPAVKSFDRDGWILFCTSFTKTLAPDFRIGWVEGGRFADKLHKLKAVSSMAESALLSQTLTVFLESGGYDHHLRALRKRYASQVEQARALIARHFPQGTRATQPAGGFVIWVDFPPGVDCVTLFRQLLKDKICMTPGQLYSPSGRYSNGLRLSCCYVFDTRYISAMIRIGERACEMCGLPPGLAETQEQAEESRTS